MSTLLKKTKNYATAIVAVLLTIGMMSFNMMTSSTLFEWYERTGPNEYVLMDDGTLSEEPSNGCIDVETELCAKGFRSGDAPDPSQITDATIAENRYTLTKF